MHRNSLIVKLLVLYGSRLPNHPRKWWVHERLRRLLRVKVDEEIEVVRHGLRWLLNPADFEHVELFWLGAKDTWELMHLRRFLKPGCVVLDVGANCGYYALTLAAALKGKCEIHAFEPHPLTNARLVKHIQWNDMTNVVHPYRVALTDVTGTARMVERSDNSGATRISDGDDGFEVQTVTLDEFAAANGISRVDCVKIDVEGVEARVLRGGRRTFEQFKPIVLIEFWPFGLARAGSTAEEVASLLEELGYLLFEPHCNPLKPLSKLPDGSDPENVLCLHRDKCPA